MPKVTPNAKVVSINAFENLQERFTELQKRYDALYQKVLRYDYNREGKTRLGELNNVLSNHNQGLCTALAVCGNRIDSLENTLVHTETELRESWQRNDSIQVSDAKYVNEASGMKEEVSKSPIQPTTKATIKPKQTTKPTKTKKTIRRKK